MRCNEFRNRIEELFDTAHADAAMQQHLEECSACRDFYDSFAATVSLLTPRHTPPLPDTLSPEDTVLYNVRQKKSRYSSSRWLSAAAVAFVVVISATVYIMSTADANAQTASSVFADATAAMGKRLSFSTTLMVRTLPQENFNYIDPEAPFVEHHLRVDYSGQKRTWSLDKGGEHYVVNNGEAQYQWWSHSRKALIQSTGDNIIDYFAMIADITRLMDYEKIRAKTENGTDKYSIDRTDSVITLTAEAGPKYNPHPIIGSNHSMDYMSNTREYCFDTSTGRLQGMRYWVTTADGRRTIVLESRDFAYGTEALLPSDITIPKETHEWTDLRDDTIDKHNNSSNASEQTKKPNCEEPGKAAMRIMRAITTQDRNAARDALATYDMDELFAQYAGYSATSCRKVFTSEGYSGVYAVIDIVSPAGERQTVRLALRYDNARCLWMLDGGL